MSENKFTEHLTRDNAAVVLVDAEDPLHAGAHRAWWGTREISIS